MKDSDFWDNPLAEPEVEGFPDIDPTPRLELAAPARADFKAYETLPVVVRRTSSLAESKEIPFIDHGIVTAIDVERNELFAGFAMERENLVRMPKTKASPASHQAITVAPCVVDLCERALLPWRRAELVVTAILRDKVSNRSKVTIGEAETAYQDPEVEKFRETKRAQIGPAPAYPSAPPASYVRTPVSPPIPDEAGVAITVDRVVVVGREMSRAMLSGSFRLPAKKEDIVPPLPAGERSSTRPTAIVGIHLLLTGSDDATPIVVRVRAPSFDPVDAAASESVVTGYFQFDLLDVGGVPDEPQTYFIYTFWREQMTGPVLMATVSEDMLPPGAL